MPGSQDYAPDPRNENALIYLNGEMVSRAEAKVSVFDAGFGMGDGVWEGVRLHKGKFLFLDAHLDRLYAGAKAIMLDIGPREAIVAALKKTVQANRMETGVHIRLMITRGPKKTINQDPRNALGKPTVVVLADYKEPSPEIVTKGLKLVTSRIRTTPPDMFDMRINSHSRLNFILAMIDVIDTGADEALMLDPNGHVASCNATNFFWVADGEVRTSTGALCFNGITRGNVIALCRANHIPLKLADFPPDDVTRADEAFVTGTFGGLTPVREIDGRKLPAALPGPMTKRLRELYAALKEKDPAS
ncbi:MAG TPA: aminotransferase class IV [Rhizomicrobium sp.]|nr:aminotransferase class IV [Rhizomicrobium sp.]